MPAYRNTVQKNTVLDVFRRERSHMTAEQIFDAVHAENPQISRSTVFRVLGQLADRGDILRIKIADGADYFDFQTHPHYHIKCVECGAVCDIEMPMLEGIEKMVTDTRRYDIIDYYIMFSGICSECKAEQN